MMRLVWSFVIVAAVGAYIGVIVPAHRAVAELESKARELYDSANRNERLVAHAEDIGKAEGRVENEIARLRGSGGIDALLEMLDHESSRVNVRVVAVTPGTAVAGNAKRGPLKATTIAIELEGRFEDLLALLKRMSTGSALVSLDSIDLTLARPQAHGAPILHAMLGARLYTIALDVLKGSTNESTSAAR